MPSMRSVSFLQVETKNEHLKAERNRVNVVKLGLKLQNIVEEVQFKPD